MPCPLHTSAPEQDLAPAVLHDGAAEIRSVTRQSILSAKGRVHGYELFFDPAAEDDGRASRTILDDMVLFGFERLTRGLPCFVRCSAEALTDRLVEVLPPPLTVLEIPQPLEITPKVLEACRALRHTGFRLALVDCRSGLRESPLLEQVDYIKVDFPTIDGSLIADLREHSSGSFATLIADNVQSQEEFRRAEQAGFSFFQGFYFCFPEAVRNARVPSNRMVHLEILQQLFRDPLDLKRLCPLVMRDAALVYRLLRLVNSPICAIRREVDSVEAAILALGDIAFRRIATLAIQCEINSSETAETIHMALVRARFCELASPIARLDANEQYLLGMMSMLPAMLRVPMTALAHDLPLRQRVVEALLGAAVPERRLLDWIEALERHNFAECRRISDISNLDQEKLNRCYLEAVSWDGLEPHLPKES